MGNKERLLRAAYTHSEELGREVEALANGGASPERLSSRKLVNDEFGQNAELVYDTVLSVLYPPN